MADTRTFIEAPNCLFLPAIEWAVVEQTLSPELRAEYGQKGYPTLEFEEGQFHYIPITINGVDYKCVQGARPEFKGAEASSDA